MYPVVGKCPVCSDTLSVTRLHCRNCDSALEGQFTLGRFYQLSPQQLAFVETYIRCEGKLTRLQDELGMSYPTARGRLTDVIRALGYRSAKRNRRSRSRSARQSWSRWPPARSLRRPR